MDSKRNKNTGRHLLAIALVSSCLAANAASLNFVMQAFPPFAVAAGDGARGMFPETVQAVCASLRVQCKLEVYPWRRALRMAEEGAADGILVIQRMPEREISFYLTAPVVQTAYGIFANDDAGMDYRASLDLSGFTVGVYGPSASSQAAAELMRSALASHLVVELDNATVLRKMSARRYGERAVAVMNIDVGNYLIRHEHIGGIKAVGEIKKIEYVIGLSRKKWTAAQAGQFNAALLDLTRNGTLAAIAERYGLHPAPLPQAKVTY